MNSDPNAMWYDERVEAFIDGDLPDNEARMFAARLSIDEQLRQSVDQALALQDALQSMPAQRCPPRVVAAIHEQTGTRNWLPAWTWPAAAMAMLLVIAINVADWLPTGVDTVPPGTEWAGTGMDQPSAEELALAREELAIALAYLDRASHIAGREVSRQVLSEGVARPLSRGMNRVTPANDVEDAS